jgi:hypothetical protein
MERIEAKVKLELDRAEKLDQDGKPYKIPNEMSDWEYLQLGSFKVDCKMYRLYPRCDHTLINESK